MLSTITQDEEREREVAQNELVKYELDRVNELAANADPRHGVTLLPRPIAALVSTGTGIASLSVRATTKVGGWTLYGFREGTLKSLSVSRSVVEQVLVLAGRDVAARSGGELGRQEAAGILEWSISTLHAGISTASFIASTGFHLGESALNSFSGVTVQMLSMLNSICGSTETSKGVASVISLLTNELNKPEAGEIISYRDIVIAVIGFVLLQRWGRRQTQIDFRNAGGEETIWDTVIDDRGWRADVVGTRRKEAITLKPILAHAVSLAGADGEDGFEALERGTLFDPQQLDITANDQEMPTDEELRDRILGQLPKGARAVITSETVTAKTIKVELYNTDTANIEAPPGTVMVAERLNHGDVPAKDAPSQTIVFRTALRRSRSSEIQLGDQLRLTEARTVHADDDADDVIMMDTPTKLKRRSEPTESKVLEAVDDHDTEIIEHEPAETEAKFSNPQANQKKSRKPMFAHISSSDSKGSRVPQVKAPKDKSTPVSRNEMGGKIRKALKTLSPSSSVAAMKDAPSIPPRRRMDVKPLPQIPKFQPLDMTPQRMQPMSSLSNGHTPMTSPIIVSSPQHASPGNYFTVHETRRDSTLMKTETYSIHSVESRPGSPTLSRNQSRTVSRPGSPTFSRTQSRTVNGISQVKSEIGLSVKGSEVYPESTTTTTNHHRSRSFVPSLYSMASKHSGEAVVLAPRKPIPRKSVYEDDKMLDLLIAEGQVPGIFPNRHLVRTVRRFARFATAVYGDGFLRFMGLKDAKDDLSKSTELVELEVPHEHSSFSSYTGLPADSILMSTFRDPQGIVSNSDWSSHSMGQLYHFISLDHDSKAIVLTCRGTLGFQDVLTDMTCDYDDIYWQGQRYQVHKGIHASARRMLWGESSRVMLTLQQALNEHKDYGLVLCGHSLGGAVAAIVAVLISEPAPDASAQSFVTGTPPKLLPSATMTIKDPHLPVPLPPGRPVHVYAYGPPATFSEPLRLATRGLITTVVNAGDIVPCLSLGTLHDFRTAAVHLKHDASDAATQLKARVWQRIMATITLSAPPASSGPPEPEFIAGDGVGQDNWAWTTLRDLRAAMQNDKLVPPGEVFLVETTQVFDRLGADVKQESRYGFGAEESKDDRTERLYQALGRPATRVQFKLIRDVEGRFGELRFGRDMFTDHSPGRYESKLGALEAGVCES
jgi:pimeloyl-ACP methyl ester carboxylesterase